MYTCTQVWWSLFLEFYFPWEGVTCLHYFFKYFKLLEVMVFYSQIKPFYLRNKTYLPMFCCRITYRFGWNKRNNVTSFQVICIAINNVFPVMGLMILQVKLYGNKSRNWCNVFTGLTYFVDLMCWKTLSVH